MTIEGRAFSLATEYAMFCNSKRGSKALVLTLRINKMFANFEKTKN